MTLQKTLKYFSIAIISILLNGCTTYVANIKKDDSFTKKLTETSVKFISNEKFEGRISRSTPSGIAEISDKDKINAALGTQELMSLFTKHATEDISKNLMTEHVSVIPADKESKNRLIITPALSDTECAPLGCQYSLWLKTDLFDKDMNKIVWSGIFKVGATFPATNDESVIHSFADTLISEFKKSHIL